ncbi:Hypothetical predicted protein [Xyrichtys novacula]|uniref:Interleukin n=1 Tax=Xyrichtys novacula TaxID=13765 RepID=A0AAV1FAF2_XYRNO|nr:Hypothetical predicted protein [Xyrichtys novacula]
MRNISIQILSAMMLVTVFSASLKPHHKDLLLEQIKNAATNMSKTNDTNGVQFIDWPKTESRCPREFFCLAEHALKATDLKNSTLTVYLETYNKHQDPKVKCPPGKTHKIRIETFLKNVTFCAGRANS